MTAFVLLVTPERNKLAEDIIEASECLKNWWDRGLIVQRGDAVVSAEDYQNGSWPSPRVLLGQRKS